MNLEDLEKLHQLKEKGIISEDEFEDAKKKYFESSSNQNSDFKIPDININLNDTNQQRIYCTAMHLSVLCGTPFAIFGLGFIVPAILWFIKKDTNPAIDRHGRVILNWVLSAIIYAAIALVLKFVLIGFPIYYGLMIANVAFSIIGAFKAFEGTLWPYPLSIPFFSIPENKQNNTF